MINGHISLHRQLINSAVWKLSPETFKIFILILLKVNFKENQFPFNGEIVELKPGQCITSLGNLSIESGNKLTIRKVRTALKQLEKLEILTNQTTNRYTLITVVNWEKYQTTRKKATNQTTKKRQTDDKQTTKKRQTNDNNRIRSNKDNNDNNEKNVIDNNTHEDLLIDLSKAINPQNYNEEEKEKRFKALENEMRTWGSWHETVCIATKKDKKIIKKLILDFLANLKSDNEYFKDLNEVRKHFRNWANKQDNIKDYHSNIPAI